MEQTLDDFLERSSAGRFADPPFVDFASDSFQHFAGAVEAPVRISVRNVSRPLQAVPKFLLILDEIFEAVDQPVDVDIELGTQSDLCGIPIGKLLHSAGQGRTSRHGSAVHEDRNDRNPERQGGFDLDADVIVRIL